MAKLQTKNNKNGLILEGLAIDDAGIFNDQFVLCYGHLVYFVAIWYSQWLSGKFLPVLVCCTKKNLATLDRAGFGFISSKLGTCKVQICIEFALIAGDEKCAKLESSQECTFFSNCIKFYFPFIYVSSW
jgi:hypothetical protein